MTLKRNHVPELWANNFPKRVTDVWILDNRFPEKYCTTYPFHSSTQAEKHNNYKVGRLFEILLTSPLINAYDVLCAVLVKDYAWLSKELQTDSQCEKGNLTIDDDVMKEAGMLVHRYSTGNHLAKKFPNVKIELRFEIHSLLKQIPVKYQVQREHFLSEVSNRETIAAIEANNDTYCVQK